MPWLVGDRIGLHPLAVIFALLAFGQLFGFAGVLLALPVSAALLVGLRHLRAAYVASPVYRGRLTRRHGTAHLRTRAARAADVRQFPRRPQCRGGGGADALRQRAGAKPACWCSGARRAPASRTCCGGGRGGADARPRRVVRRDARVAAATRPSSAVALVAIDDVDRADAAAQAGSSRCSTRLPAHGRTVRWRRRGAAGGLPLRDDLRTRLGWGLVYEVRPLADADKPAALGAYARERGFRLADDVIAYLLAHGRRDMTTLVATLAALDRHSLAPQRPITVPLLRDWLQREIGLGNPAPPA